MQLSRNEPAEGRRAMSVNKYQMFLKTVACGSFSKAAEELNFTQSAVSCISAWC